MILPDLWKIIRKGCKKINKQFLENENNKYFNKIITNLTVFSGGKLSNCTPSESFIQVDIRFPPSIKSKTILEKIRNDINIYKQNYEEKNIKSIDFQEKISSLIEGFEINNNN